MDAAGDGRDQGRVFLHREQPTTPCLHKNTGPRRGGQDAGT
jgi:hypothetical protein